MILVAGPYRSGTVAIRADAAQRRRMTGSPRSLPAAAPAGHGRRFALPAHRAAERDDTGGDPIPTRSSIPSPNGYWRRCDAPSPRRARPKGRTAWSSRRAPREDRVHTSIGTSRERNHVQQRAEMMIVAAARGPRGAACPASSVARSAEHRGQSSRSGPSAPTLELVLRGGRTSGPDRRRLPLSIGDPTIVTGSTRGRQHARAVRLLLAGRPGRCRFLGAAQIDPVRQHQHTQSSGPYDHPKTRLPGAVAHARSPSTRARSS
jgi:hypothetical protein